METERDHSIEDSLCREFYSLGTGLSKEASLPFAGKVHLESFLKAAGFKKIQILYQEKWLSKLPVNSALNALSCDLGKLAENADNKLVDKDLLLICELLLETTVKNQNQNILEQLLFKIVKVDKSYNILCKVLEKADTGHIQLSATVLISMFETHPKLLDLVCKTISQKLKRELVISWIVKTCSQSLQLYDLVSNNLKEQYPSILPMFVESVCQLGNIIVYPNHELSCVILCLTAPAITEQPLRDLNNSKLMSEFLQLWLTHRQSTLKLVHHFPYLSKCLVECCDKDNNAKRLCLHLISCKNESIACQ